MSNLDADRLKKEWFSFEEIERIKNSLENFEKTGVSHSHQSVKKKSREDIFSKSKINV